MNKDWNIKSLKEHYDAVLKLNKQRLKEKFRSLQIALEKAEVTYEHKFEANNQWKQTVTNMQGEYAKKIQLENINDKLASVKERMDKLEGRKEGGNIVWAYVVAFVSLLASLIALIR